MGSRSQSALDAERRSLDAQLAECAASGSDIEAQIERLNAAKRLVAPIDEAVDGVRWQVALDRGVARWKGYRRDRYDDHASEVDESLRTYTGGASDVYSHICDQITALENKRYDNEGVFGWLKKRLNDVQNELEKLVN